MNNRSFENGEKTLKELQSLCFYTLYLWPSVLVYPLVLVVMIPLICFLLLVRYFPIYTLELLYAFHDKLITYQKNLVRVETEMGWK